MLGELVMRYERGSATPCYVERLDEEEWPAEHQRPDRPWVRNLINWTALFLWLLFFVILVALLIVLLDARPPADLFPERIGTPAPSPEVSR